MTIRARLTLVYGGLFLFAGAVLLGVTYVLVSNRVPDNDGKFNVQTVGPEPAPSPGGASRPPSGTISYQDGQLDGQRDFLGSLLTQGTIALIVVSAATVALGWLLAGRLLQPLNRVTETARRIADAPAADRGLHERIALPGPSDEIKQLADTFDVMLERLDHSFDGQRRFIANASHELRTPLTLNRALLEVAVHRRGSPPEIVHLGETLLEINTRHERLIDGLLMLARSEPEIVEHSYVDLADIADHLTSQIPPGKIDVRLTLDEAPTRGNPVLLERLIQNLIDNALRYNVPENGWIALSTSTSSTGEATLTITNPGPLVPRYELPTLFEPFRRLNDRLHTPSGAGLGLSIVQAIARAHNGTACADSRETGGLTLTVALPPPLTCARRTIWPGSSPTPEPP